MSKKVEEQRTELLNWQMLRDSADDLFEELDARIASVKKELKKTRKKEERERLQGVLNTYNSIRQQMTENVAVSSGQIHNLSENIRKDIKAEQIELFKKKNREEKG